MLRNLGLGPKLSFGFGLAFALSLLVGIVALAETRAVEDVADQTITVVLPHLEELGRLKYHIAQYSLLTDRQIDAVNPEDARRVAQAASSLFDEINRGVATIVGAEGTPEESEKVGAFQRAWSNYLAQRGRATHELETGDAAAAGTVFNDDGLSEFG